MVYYAWLGCVLPMSWRYHGRARSLKSPYAICDRCGLLYNYKDLVFQFDYAGPRLMNKRILVCTKTCVDVPFLHHIPIVTPPDPVPLMNPRPDLYLAAQNGPTNLKDTNGELIRDTNGAPILATPDGTINVPPYPFAGFVMLRADGGGPVTQTAVRDEGYAVQVRNDVQGQGNPAQTPHFNTTPATTPNRPYNNLNILNNQPGQVGSQYAFPVILEIPD
jgi:hypothetical protein